MKIHASLGDAGLLSRVLCIRDVPFDIRHFWVVGLRLLPSP
jgi:hypothetical protein